MSKTFTNGGCSVTVHDDRSIRVQSGDWISKYSMAIYGDPRKNWDRFKRKQGAIYIDLADPNRIVAGETLYHPGPLPGEPSPDPDDRDPAARPPLRADYACRFLDWVKARFIKTDWRVDGSAGGDASFLFFSGQYATIGVVKDSVQTKTWFHALAAGLTVGFPTEGCTVGGSFSTTHFKSWGRVLRSPFRRQISLQDFRHGVVVLDFSPAYYLGGSGTLLFFGISAPILLLAAITRYIRLGNPRELQDAFQQVAPAGVALLGGINLALPGVSFAARAGFMYDRGYWGL